MAEQDVGSARRHNRARSSGAAMRVAVTPGTSVARVLVILGLNRILSVYDSVEDAQAHTDVRQLFPR